MPRILALGVGPLLESGVRFFSAHALRTWHLTKALLGEGREVALFTLPIFSDEPGAQERAGVEQRRYEGFAYSAFLNHDEAHNLKRLEEACRAFRPDCILGINSGPSALVSKLAYPAPLWADLNGSVLVEGQAKSFVYGNNSLLDHYWRMEEAALRRADHFSTPTMRQLHFVHGELGAVGRLNRQTFNYAFADYIPEACNPLFADPEAVKLGSVRLRGERIPHDAFILLWSGGFNCWTDYDILFRALECAMETVPSLHFAATGGALYGHDDLSFPRFQAMTRESRFRERFHLLGWLDAKDLPSIYAEADLALCVDAPNMETRYGARTRILSMMAAGLPVLATLGAEISDELARDGFILGCAAGSAESLAEGIVDAWGQREGLRGLGAKGRAVALDRFSYTQTAEPLLRWTAAPAYAPDNELKLARGSGTANPFLIALNPIERMRGSLDATPAPAQPAGALEPLKRWAERAIGPERYAKLRFLRQEWLRRALPRYWRGRRDKSSPVRVEDLEELIVEIGSEDGTLRLDEYAALARSLPRLETLAFVGAEPEARGDFKAILQTLAGQTQAWTVRIGTDALAPARLDALCGALLEEGLPDRLEVWVRLDGSRALLERREDGAARWSRTNLALYQLQRHRAQWPAQFDFAVLTRLSEESRGNLETLDADLRERFACRHVFEIASEGPPIASWREVAGTIKRLNRRAGMANSVSPLALRFALLERETGRSALPRAAAGRRIAMIRADGAICLCPCGKPFGAMRDYGMDFAKAWLSQEALAARSALGQATCLHPSCLTKDIERSWAGLVAMARDS